MISARAKVPGFGSLQGTRQIPDIQADEEGLYTCSRYLQPRHRSRWCCTWCWIRSCRCGCRGRQAGCWSRTPKCQHQLVNLQWPAELFVSKQANKKAFGFSTISLVFKVYKSAGEPNPVFLLTCSLYTWVSIHCALSLSNVHGERKCAFCWKISLVLLPSFLYYHDCFLRLLLLNRPECIFFP